VPKVLAKSGDSLADLYDVVGSIAGVEELQSRDVQLLHEMGGTIFSERLSTRILSDTSGAVAQSTAIDTVILGFTTQPLARILGIFVFVDVTARIADLAVSLEDDAAVGQGIPIWVWGGTEDVVRMVDAGVGVNAIALVPTAAFNLMPALMLGTPQPERTPNLTMRGNTSAFGAGTVEAIVHTLIAFPALGGVSSRGLPLPSW